MKNEILLSTPKKTLSRHLKYRHLVIFDDNIEYALIIDDKTTLNEVKKSWNDIKRRAESLVEIQGSNPDDFQFSYYAFLLSLKNIGKYSYEEIVLEVNFDILLGFVIIEDYVRQGDKKRAKETLDFVALRLFAMGFKWDRINEEIAEYLFSINRNELPWILSQGPVDKQRVVDILRKIKAHLKSGKMKVGDDLTVGEVYSVIRYEESETTKRAAKKCEALLAKYSDAGGYDKLSRARRRLQKNLKGG